MRYKNEASSFNYILIVIVNLTAQEWTDISPFPASNLSIRGNFISDEEGWIFQLGRYISRDIYHTLDGGQNWEIIYSLEDPLEYFISLNMIDCQHGWATKRWRDNLYPYNSYYSYVKTTDGGYSWEDMTDNLPELNYIYPIYFIDQNIGFFGAGSDTLSYQALIYKTIDGGENWDVGIEPGPPDLFDIHFVDLNYGGVAGRSAASTYVAITEDNFETISYQYDNSNWNQLAQAICFQSDSTIWVTGIPGVINRSTDNGATFEVFQIIDADLNSIQFFGNTGYIFDHNNALLKFVDSVDINNNFITQAKDFNLKVYPNPSNPITTISFTIHEESKVELIIYNIKGQKIKTLIHNEFIEGDHSINWVGVDELNEPVGSGVYFYKLKVNSKTETAKKMLLLK